jgi:hypothetical protein
MTDGSGPRPVTPALTGAFFALAFLLTGLAGVTLTFPGGPLDWIWRFKSIEHDQLLRMAPLVGYGFLALSIIMAAASVGAFGRRCWGWMLAVAIFGVNGVGDAVHMASGALLGGAIGVAAAGAILWWLTRPRVRALFDR